MNMKKLNLVLLAIFPFTANAGLIYGAGNVSCDVFLGVYNRFHSNQNNPDYSLEYNILMGWVGGYITGHQQMLSSNKYNMKFKDSDLSSIMIDVKYQCMKIPSEYLMNATELVNLKDLRIN